MRFSLSPVLLAALALTACTGAPATNKDNSGGGTTDDANAKPVAEITSHQNGASVGEGETITLTGSATDAEDGATELVGSWHGGGQELCAPAALGADGTSECEVAIAIQDALITFSVIDTGKFIGTAELSLDIVPTEAPACEISSPANNDTFTADDVITFTATVADKEDKARDLIVYWEDVLDGTTVDTPALDTTPDADGVVSGSSTMIAGDHTIYCQVTDTTGKSSYTYVNYTVTEGNAAPTVSILTPTEDEVVNEGDEIVFTAVVSDDSTAADALSLAWEDSVDGVLDYTPADAAGDAGFSTGALTAGEHVVTLSATDTEGKIGTATVTFDVNSLPTMPTVSISPASPYTNDDLTVHIDADSTDADGGTITYTYAWWRNGVLTGETGASVAASVTTRGDEWTVMVTPDDGSGSGPAGSATVTVGNTAPVLADASLSPDPAYEGDTLTCAPGATSDIDGDSVSVIYGWMVNGTVIADTGSTLDSSSWSSGDTVQCMATPDDGDAVGSSVSSNVVTIANSLPVTTAPTITPSPAKVTSALTCTPGSTTDADGTSSFTYTYAWTVDGVDAGVSSSTLVAGTAVKGQSVVCTVTPNDGSADGTAMASSAETIQNSTPTAPVVAVSPSEPEDGDDLTCSIVAPSADADGDGVSYTYSWEVDGSDAGIYSATVPESSTAVGDAWTCSVVGGDGAEFGPAGMDSVNVGGCYALDFDGSNDYVLVTASGDISYGSSFSAEAWVYASSGAGYQRIAGHDHNYAWHLDLEASSTVRFQLNDTASQQATAPLTLGAWHHIAGVLTAGNLYLYVDGVLAGTGTGTSPGTAYTARDVSLGGDSYWTSDYPWSGMIGPTRISSNARYTATFTPEWGWTDDANTIALWNFGEGSGTTLGDSSANENDGTVVGATWTSVVCP